MACETNDLIQGVINACGGAIGSVSDVWYCDINEVDLANTLVVQTATKTTLTALTLNTANVMGHLQHSKNNTAFAKETGTDNNGPIANQTLLQFLGLSPEKIEVANKAYGCCGLLIIVKYNDGQKRVFGIQYNYTTSELELATVPPVPKFSTDSGTNVTDSNFLGMEFNGQQRGLALYVDIPDADLTAL